MVKNILRLEGAIVLLVSLYAFNRINGNWFLFLALLFAVDFSMIGYLRDKRLGAITYNLLHNYVVGLAAFFIGFVSSNILLAQLGLILTAHVGMDRMLGLGLKYPTGFKDTHLQKV